MGHHTDSNSKQQQQDATLSRAALDLLCRYHNNGEVESLERLGIDLKLIIRVRRLTTESYHRLLGRLGNFVKLHLDNQILDTHLQMEEDYMQRQSQARRLIREGAPFPMIRDLYGWTREAFHFERRIIGLASFQPNRGRPPLPPEQTGDRIAQAWYEVNGSDRSTPETSEQWLELMTTSNASLAEIWSWYCSQRKEITHG
jgi:hypothetical protein